MYQTQKNKNKTKKVVLLSTLAILAIGSIGSTLAYWASTVNGSETGADGNVNIGEGDAVDTKLSVSAASAGKYLVPVGLATQENQVEELEIVFTVNWSSDALRAPKTAGKLMPTLTEVTTPRAATPDEQAAVRALINCDFDRTSYAIATDSDPVLVTAAITLEEPPTAEIYQLIAGQNLSLVFNFAVTIE